MQVHPQCTKKEFLFAGSDEARAQAFYGWAKDPALDVLWCARGGYGGVRILPLLEKLCSAKGAPPPGKLLVGYSDSTALFDFVRKRWGWSALHAPMPGMREFLTLKASERDQLWKWIRRDASVLSLATRSLFSSARILNGLNFNSSGSIEKEMVGGNLSVLSSLAGTAYFPDLKGKFLFIEDVAEPLYRIDRMVMQLRLAKQAEGIAAVFLGNFLECGDRVSQVLKVNPKNPRSPRPQELGPLRKSVGAKAGLIRIFSEWTQALGVPLLGFLPVGHGSGKFALPIGARCQVQASGALQWVSWPWMPQKP